MKLVMSASSPPMFLMAEKPLTGFKGIDIFARRGKNTLKE